MELANPARQMSFSPDGRLLVVFEWNMSGMRGGSSMSFRIWDTSTGLPCGPAVPLRKLPVELLLDREVKWLTQKAPFDTAATLLIQLPECDVPISEMERRSQLLSCCRLDKEGNVEVLTAPEILQLQTDPEMP